MNRGGLDVVVSYCRAPETSRQRPARIARRQFARPCRVRRRRRQLGGDHGGAAATTAGWGARPKAAGGRATDGGRRHGDHGRRRCPRGRAPRPPADGETGDPIKVMTETAIDTNLTPYENIRDASKYYAQWVNEQGGIVDGNGVPHKLEVTFCDDKYDPNEAANCARTGGRREAHRQHRRVHHRCQPGHPDLRGGQGRLVRRVLPDRRPGEQVADLVPARLRRWLPDGCGAQDGRGRLQARRRRQRRPPGRRRVPPAVRSTAGRPPAAPTT